MGSRYSNSSSSEEEDKEQEEEEEEEQEEEDEEEQEEENEEWEEGGEEESESSEEERDKHKKRKKEISIIDEELNASVCFSIVFGDRSSSLHETTTVTKRSTTYPTIKKNGVIIPDVFEEEEKKDGTGTCTLCFTRNISTVIKNCGHAVFCGECCRKMKVNRCPICREEYNEVIRLFLVENK